jgi:alkylation response protein AidB-like acyl-CoA dehydrogenase
MGHSDPIEEAALLDAIERWLEKEVRPQVMRLEHDDIYPREMVETMKQMGLFGAVLDPKWGGLGLSASTYAKIVMQISTVWMSLTGIFNSHLMMAMLVQKFGTEEQKQRFLPRMASGELRGGLALTEPDAGTDVGAIRTRAVKDGDHYVVSGTKTWISNGIEGGCCAVLVRTDPRADPPRKGLSMFIMEKGPGFTASRKLEKIGYKGIDSAELAFDNFRVPAANLVGGEGKGFYCAVSGLELGRINVAPASPRRRSTNRYAMRRSARLSASRLRSIRRSS